jgi:hypothetical protein
MCSARSRVSSRSRCHALAGGRRRPSRALLVRVCVRTRSAASGASSSCTTHSGWPARRARRGCGVGYHPRPRRPVRVQAVWASCVLRFAGACAYAWVCLCRTACLRRTAARASRQPRITHATRCIKQGVAACAAVGGVSYPPWQLQRATLFFVCLAALLLQQGRAGLRVQQVCLCGPLRDWAGHDRTVQQAARNAAPVLAGGV